MQLRSIALNEFKGPAYDAIGGSGIREGDSCLEVRCCRFGSPGVVFAVTVQCPRQAFGFFSSAGWQVGGVVLLNCYYAILGIVVVGFLLNRSRDAALRGTLRRGAVGLSSPGSLPHRTSSCLWASTRTRSGANPLAVASATLAWRDLVYGVYSGQRGTKAVTLLRGVSGIAEPGELWALMGASGAGGALLCVSTPFVDGCAVPLSPHPICLQESRRCSTFLHAALRALCPETSA